MKVRNGIDLCDINRMLVHVTENNMHFLERCFTEAELEYSLSHKNELKRAESLAARFAAKEATGKALGIGICAQGVNLKDIEILKDSLGAPTVKLHGAALDKAKALMVISIAVSITHEKDYAAAAVTLLTNEEDL